MLTIVVPSRELWDEKNNEFIIIKDQKLSLEHSLVSISKWEAKWHKPFINKDKKTVDEIIDYVRCMNTTQNVDPNVFNYLTSENLKEVTSYIENTMTATWFSEDNNNQKGNSEQITSELIYYWMVALQIPFECQRWHLNRLLTLIRICNIKNKPPKKYSKREIMSKNAALNAARKKQLGTSG